MKYKYLKHTADVKFQAFGDTLEEAFSSAFDALKEVMVDKEKILEKEKKDIEINGKDLESLLYNFLEEFLFLLDSEDFIISKIKKIKIDSKKFKLKATILGDFASKYKFTNDVKAITYNEIFVKKKEGKHVVQVVVDV